MSAQKKAAVSSATTPAKNARSGTKRKNSTSDKVDDLPMLERLRLLSKETEHVTTPPRTDSVIQLLVQGLNNNDAKILDSVLSRPDTDLIDKTVKKLPVQSVVPLIHTLQSRITGRGLVNHAHSKWLRSVLENHTAYLMSSPNCQKLLESISVMLEERTRHYNALVQLKGKLDIIHKQISSQPSDQGNVDASKEALLVYQDDSSDEIDDVLNELMIPASDNEEGWNLDDDDDEVSDEDSEESEEEVEMLEGEEESDDDEEESD